MPAMRKTSTPTAAPALTVRNPEGLTPPSRREFVRVSAVLVALGAAPLQIARPGPTEPEPLQTDTRPGLVARVWTAEDAARCSRCARCRTHAHPTNFGESFCVVELAVGTKTPSPAEAPDFRAPDRSKARPVGRLLALNDIESSGLSI